MSSCIKSAELLVQNNKSTPKGQNSAVSWRNSDLSLSGMCFSSTRHPADISLHQRSMKTLLRGADVISPHR